MARLPKKAAWGLVAGALAALGVAALELSGLVARWEAPLADWHARALARPSPATQHGEPSRKKRQPHEEQGPPEIELFLDGQ